MSVEQLHGTPVEAGPCRFVCRRRSHHESRPASLVLVAAALLAGCGSQRSQEGPQLTPAEVRAQVARLIPSSVVDRQGWATDIQVAFTAQELATVKSNFCAVLAVTEQESTYQADPAVPGLAKIARQEIDRRAARLHLPGFWWIRRWTSARPPARPTPSASQPCAPSAS